MAICSSWVECVIRTVCVATGVTASIRPIRTNMRPLREQRSMIMQSKAATEGNATIVKDISHSRRKDMFTDRNEGCDYRIARSRKEFEDTFRLIYEEYLQQRLTRPNRLNLRILPHQLLQTSWVFNAVQDENAVATLSLVEDGQYGMPMDDIYGQEVGRLRQAGKQLAELTCLAHRPHTPETMWNRGKVTSTLGTLMGLTNSLALKRGVDGLVICVHPRHATFYQRRYGFVELGPNRYCPWAKNHPAKALLLDRRGMLTALHAFESTARYRQLAAHLNSYHQTESPNSISAEAIAHFWGLLDQVSPISIPPQDQISMTA
jgi:hypothetical protein